MKFPARYYTHPKHCQITLGKKERKGQLIFLWTLIYVAVYFKFATLKIIIYILILNKNEYALILKSILDACGNFLKSYLYVSKKKEINSLINENSDYNLQIYKSLIYHITWL